MRWFTLLALFLGLCATVLCDDDSDVTAAESTGTEAPLAADAPMAADAGMQNQPMGGMNNPCAYTRCGQRFTCVAIPSPMGNGFRTPYCVRQGVDCDDLTDEDDDWSGGNRPPFGKRQMGMMPPAQCQNTYQCNQHLMMGGGMMTGMAYSCCRVGGEFVRRCVEHPKYRPMQ
ncbi:uncharacterized protein [Littorina saxatilis]|uniref:Uncharacterized protein n=1 Tax=Littorina saxatilis TaxID=31220 RepID=A0AAN9AYL8_9CAEN